MIFKVPFDETEKVVLGLDYWYKRTENKKKNNDTKEIRTPASYDSRNPWIAGEE